MVSIQDRVEGLVPRQMLNLGDSLSVHLNDRDPVRAIQILFQAREVYRWPDLECHWFAKLTYDQCWHVVRLNPLNDRLKLDLTTDWSFECPTGFEAWLRWNIRVERQLVDLAEPKYRRSHENRLLVFREELLELNKPIVIV